MMDEICAAVDPVSGRRCGFYTPHKLPHELLSVDLGRRRRRGESRVQWDDRHRWEKFGSQRFNLVAIVEVEAGSQ